MINDNRLKMPSLYRLAVVVLVIIAACALMGSSCHKKREKKKLQGYSDELHEIVTDFNKLIVWRGYEPASMMVLPSKRLDFLMDAEKYGVNLHIENYSVVLCKVTVDPPVRDLGLPESTDALSVHDDKPKTDKAPDKVEAADEAKPDEAKPDEAGDEVGKDEAGDVTGKDEVAEKTKEVKKPQIYYGTALVRYINRSVEPSISVDTKLIKQYWINIEGAWYCDFSWPDMLKR
jgi:hypothetical protein